jgi:hypothetical protein
MTRNDATQPTAEQIDRFFADPAVQRLTFLTTTSKPLEICYLGEIAITNFMRWLLDPSEGHGLGDMPVKSLLTQAWLNSKDMANAQSIHEALSPAEVHTTGYSGLVALAEASLQSRRLDVLLVDPATKTYVAVEGKYGSKQSKDQLSDYRKSLKTMFKEYTGVHIFMDWYSDDPKDPAWIPVGYEWLLDFLRQAEERSATAEHIRETISQFREALEWEDAAGYDSPENKTIAHLASTHGSVVRVMAEWLGAHTVRERGAVLARLASEQGEMAGLRLRLYQLFLRRPVAWARCAKVVRMAPFLTRLQRSFNGVLVDQGKSWTAFSLTQFEELNDPDDDDPMYPAYVKVWEADGSYTVSALIETSTVRREMREKLRQLAETMAKAGKITRRQSSTTTWFVVQSQKKLSLAEATTASEAMMRELAGTVVAHMRQTTR